MQQLTIITVFVNCLDHGLEIPGTKTTGHSQCTNKQVHVTSLLLAALLGKIADYYFCLDVHWSNP